MNIYSDVKKRKKSNGFKNWWKRNIVGYTMMAPFLILFTVFVLCPVVISIVLSFTNYNMFQAPSFVGINNYKLLLSQDDIFRTAAKNTFVYACVVGPVGYFMSFFAAWVLNGLKMKNGFALAFYAPSICSGVAMSAVWLYFFSSDRYGLINNILSSVGLIDEPVLWTKNPKYILGVVMFVGIWMSMGTGFLVFLAGLQNADKTLIEAGQIDGIKTHWQELKFITLPQMKPQLLFGAITVITNSFSVYDIAVAIAGFPSPNYSAHTIVAHLFDYAFVRFQMGYASAISTVLFLITFVVGKITMRLLIDRS